MYDFRLVFIGTLFSKAKMGPRGGPMLLCRLLSSRQIRADALVGEKDDKTDSTNLHIVDWLILLVFWVRVNSNFGKIHELSCYEDTYLDLVRCYTPLHHHRCS